MSFIPICNTHSPHTYFAFILHLFMFCLVISALTKVLGWARSCTNILSWPVGPLTCIIHAVKQKVCEKAGTHMVFPCSNRILLWVWKDVTSAPALKGCGWFWSPSPIYMLPLWKWEEVSKLFCNCRKYCLGCCKLCPVRLSDPSSGTSTKKSNIGCPCWFRSQ